MALTRETEPANTRLSAPRRRLHTDISERDRASIGRAGRDVPKSLNQAYQSGETWFSSFGVKQSRSLHPSNASIVEPFMRTTHASNPGRDVKAPVDLQAPPDCRQILQRRRTRGLTVMPRTFCCWKALCSFCCCAKLLRRLLPSLHVTRAGSAPRLGSLRTTPLTVLQVKFSRKIEYVQSCLSPDRICVSSLVISQ